MIARCGGICQLKVGILATKRTRRERNELEQFLQKNKWSILAAGAAIQILTGIPAAWGVFQGPVRQEYGFDENAASFIFSFIIGAFGIGCVLGGYLQDKCGPRVAGLTGTALLAAGFFAAGFLPQNKVWLFYLCFSVPVGLGCAFLYPAVMSCAQKWYADKKGLATGVIGGAVGFSGAALTFAVRWLSGIWGIRVCFWVLGGVMLVVCGAGSILLKNPTQKAAAQPNADAPKKDYTVLQMLKTRQYWLVTAVVALGTPAVLLFSPIIVRLGQERGLSENAAHWAIIIGSVGSAAGRLSMPALSDKIGRRATDLLLFTGLAGLSVWFIFTQNGWMIAVYTALTFCYAGEAAVLPSLCTDLFGMKNTGVNYGFLALGMTVGSLGFPLIARMLDLELARHFIAIGAAAAGILCLWMLKPTQDEKI